MHEIAMNMTPNRQYFEYNIGLSVLHTFDNVIRNQIGNSLNALGLWSIHLKSKHRGPLSVSG